MKDIYIQYKHQLEEDIRDYQQLQELGQAFEILGPKKWEEKEILDFQQEREKIFERLRNRAMGTREIEAKITDNYGRDAFISRLESESDEAYRIKKELEKVRTSLIDLIQNVVKFDQKLEMLLQQEKSLIKSNLTRIQKTRHSVEAYSKKIDPEARFIDRNE